MLLLPGGVSNSPPAGPAAGLSLSNLKSPWTEVWLEPATGGLELSSWLNLLP